MSIKDAFSLDGRVAVVTGGGGLYGRQVVEALAEAGAHVVAASRDVANLERLVEPWIRRGLAVSVMRVDQSDEASVLALRDGVLEAHGRVDVLVNNAVLRPMTGWDGPAEAFGRSMAVNATGLFLMTRAFGEPMAERGAGSIVNIGSIHGMAGPDFTLYAPGSDMPPDYFFHKGGMLQLTRFAAARLGPRGVRVNTISAGGFFNNQDPQFVERYNARTFLGRMAGGEDLKGAVVFLASEASAYVTGANLVVDGGYTAK